MSEVRGSGQECQAAMAQEQRRGATPRPRSGAVAESARLRRRRNSQEELPHVRGQGRRPGGATPTSKEWWLCGRRRAQRSYSTFQVRWGGSEEIPLVQGKEQRLHFAGAAVKR